MCRAADHVYHVDFNPPKVEGVCDVDGSELYRRDDDDPDVVRTRFRKQWIEAAAPVIAYYRGHGIAADLDAAQSVEDVAGALDGLLDGLAART
jgi:adenylate kinase